MLQTKVVYIKCRRNPLLAAVSSVRPCVFVSWCCAALPAAVCWPNLTNLSSLRAGPQPRHPAAQLARLESCLAAGQPSVVATPASASASPQHTEAASRGRARPGEVVIMQKYLRAMQRGTDHIPPAVTRLIKCQDSPQLQPPRSCVGDNEPWPSVSQCCTHVI